MNGWVGFRATLDGVVLSGRRFDWKAGHFVRSIDGLDDGADVSFSDVGAGRFPGVEALPGKRDAARSIVFRGFTWAPTQSMLEALRTQLGAVLQDEERFAKLAWSHLGVERYTTVQRGRGNRYTLRGSSGFADFTLAMRAPDQRIYEAMSEWSAWGSSVELAHRGTYPAPTRIQVRGARVGGYTVSGPNGRRWVTTRDIAAGSVHEFDSDEGGMLVDSVPAWFGLTRTDSIEIPPGLHTVSVNGGLECRVRFPTTFNP